ncbi:phage terminase large subunit [Niabella sp. CC-SYL272]|uniref:PBSX family phage terminase large subunit n=1 Tax=Niabella agricola TaxID=2891571 RepID=UPI001F285FF7|nr:phage terminase large subunit [Niabella agricola]MCF3107309.1 phage terminase large subunit [Niabella agricola]
MIKIQEPYKPLYTSDKFIILITGGRGSGKSFNAATFIERLSFEKGHKMLYSRYTMTAANISVIPEFTNKIELEGFQNQFTVTTKDIINTFSESQIMFRGIKTSSGNQTANLKSIEGLTTFIGDEMEEWESEDDFDKLVLSIRQKGIQNRVILIMNPSDSEHFVYKKYIENTHKIVNIDGVDVQISTHPDVLHIHTSYLDNIEHLADQFLNTIQGIKEKSIKDSTVNGILDKEKFLHSKYATKVIGRWTDTPEGAIYTNWEEGEFDESLPYGYGQDYGFMVDPDTLIRCAVDNKRMRVYVDEEYYDRAQLSTDQLYEMNKSRIKRPNDLIVADSAEARLIADLRAKGLNIVECEKGQGSVTAGIKALQSYTIVVTPRSNNVKRELRNYKWSDKKAGIPIDDYNHAMDSLRYISKRLGIKTMDLAPILAGGF